MRGIDASDGRLIGRVRGEVGRTEDGVLIIRRIHVTYELAAGEEHRETVERVHGIHAMKCPVYRTVHTAIDVSTEYLLTG